MKRLYLSDTDRKIGGVCGGLGEYFDKDPTIFRILFVALTLFLGGGILLYIIMWLIMPRKPRWQGGAQ
jgi:phage shock protein PspC (stress-responsive transcriptional regulator)